MIPEFRLASQTLFSPPPQQWLVKELAKHFGEDVEVSYYPSMGETLSSVGIESINGDTDIDLVGDNQKELQQELDSILSTLRNKVRPRSIKLKRLSQEQSSSNYDRVATDCLMNALHKQV